MTFNAFKKDLMIFLKASTVNLGRKKANTRKVFIDTVVKKLDDFAKGEEITTINKKDKSVKPLDKSVIRIKPKDLNRSLSVGKGVHAMTASESMRADEQLNRSPYSQQNDKKG